MKYLGSMVTRPVLDLAYKMHVRPHLEYGDILFHECSQTLSNQLERVQTQAALIVSGCWQGSNMEKVRKELGWESLHDRRKFHRLSLYYKIKNNLAPPYLTPYVLDAPPSGTLRYKRSFFPYCYNEWELLDPALRNSVDLPAFKSKYVKLMRPPKVNTYGIKDIFGLKLLTRLRVDFSDLRLHRLNHNFNCSNATCACGTDEESPEHFLLHCPRFALPRTSLLNSISAAINPAALELPHLPDILLNGSPAFNDITNKIIIESTIRFIRQSGRFKVLEASLKSSSILYQSFLANTFVSSMNPSLASCDISYVWLPFPRIPISLRITST